MAITWKNVNGPALPDAGRLMDSAVASFARAGVGLQNEVGKFEQQKQDVLDRGREAGVNAVMMKLNEISSPEQYAEMEKTGQFKAMMAGLDLRDQAALMQAPDARLQSLLQRSDQTRLRTRQEEALAAESTIADMDRYSLAGDATSAKQQVDFLPAALQAKALRQINADQFALADRAQKATLAPLDIRAKQATIDNAETQRMVAEESLRQSQKNATYVDTDREAAKNIATLNAQKEILKETSYGEGVWNPSRAQELMDIMVKAGIGDDNGERQAIVRRFNKKPTMTIGEGKNAREIPIPFSMVKAAVLGSEDELANMWDEGYANSAEENLKAALGLTSKVKGSDGKLYDQSNIVRDYDAYTQMQKNFLTTPGPIGTPKIPKVLKPK